jgi:hypothetical protein
MVTGFPGHLSQAYRSVNPPRHRCKEASVARRRRTGSPTLEVRITFEPSRVGRVPAHGGSIPAACLATVTGATRRPPWGPQGVPAALGTVLMPSKPAVQAPGAPSGPQGGPGTLALAAGLTQQVRSLRAVWMVRMLPWPQAAGGEPGGVGGGGQGRGAGRGRATGPATRPGGGGSASRERPGGAGTTTGTAPGWRPRS